MERKILQDVVPPKRSIRSVVKDAPVERFVREERDVYEEPVVPTQPKKPRPPKRSFSKIFVSSIVLLSILILAFAFSLIYASATVKISPKMEEVVVDDTFTAKKDAKATELQYEVMTLTKQRGEVVVATNGEHIEKKARGTVVLYNAYSATPQRLVVNTRLENTKGQIYRTDKAVVIPGYKTVDGRVIPGSVEVGITASQPGTAYNAEMAELTGDFKITAFRGDAKFNGFYGRLKSDISGGYIGIEKIIPPQVASSTKAKMRAELQKDILAEAASQVPQGFVLYDGAHIIEYSTLPNTQKTNQEVILNEKATLYAVIFRKDTLNKFIASNEVAQFAKGNVDAQGIEDLKFLVQNTREFNPRNETPLVFSLQGEYKLIGVFPEDELKTKLKGSSVKDIATVLSQYGTITSADVILRPFWKRTFPLREDRITVEKVI